MCKTVLKVEKDEDFVEEIRVLDKRGEANVLLDEIEDEDEDENGRVSLRAEMVVIVAGEEAAIIIDGMLQQQEEEE